MVTKAETTLRMALELTANSEEAMTHLKQSLRKKFQFFLGVLKNESKSTF